MSPPLIVEVTRGGVVESHHEVDVAIVGTDGHRSSFGKPQRWTLARSSMKPIQAFPLVATGAADAFDLTQAHLAFACASHNGEPRHVDTVTEWLGRLGYDADTLECGTSGGFRINWCPRSRPIVAITTAPASTLAS